MAKVEWLARALVDIDRLYNFLEDKNPLVAKQAAARIKHGALLLKDSPHIGRPMPDETGRRELFMSFGAGAYVLRYMQEKDTVVVIRVWHSRENRDSKVE